MSEHEDYLSVVNHVRDRLHHYLVVEDERDGLRFRINADESIDGKLKVNGGGGFRPDQRDRFEAGKDVVQEYFTDLSYEVLPKDEWSYQKFLRGHTWNERQKAQSLIREVSTSPLTFDEARQLVHDEVGIRE